MGKMCEMLWNFPHFSLFLPFLTTPDVAVIVLIISNKPVVVVAKFEISNTLF